MVPLRCLLLVMAWLWPVLAVAQPVPPTPRQLTVFDGLPSNTVNRMAEDGYGYLWIATNDGLARYDGRNYRIWRAEDGLRDNHVWSVHVDARNQLWIGTENAGLVMMSADRREMRFFDRSSHPTIGSNTIWSITSTADGTLWFGTYEGGLHRLDRDGKVTRFMPEHGNPRSLPAASVTHLATTRDGSLWVGTKAGLARWTGSDFERVPNAYLPEALINGLTAELDGSLWISTNAGVVVRRPDGRYEPAPWKVSAGDQILGMMLRDEQGGYWLDTRSGLGRAYDNQFQQVPLYSAVARGQVRPNWTGAYEDREGGIWLASTNGGLWHLLPRWWQFSVLSRLEDDPSSLRNAYVLGMAAAADGGVWAVGTHGALDKFDPVSGAITQHRTWVDGNQWLQSVLEDPHGRVWIGSADALLRYDPNDATLRRWGRDAAVDAAMDGQIESLALCDGGRVWSAASTGLQQRDLEGRVLHRVAVGHAGLAAGQLALDIQCGVQDHLWAATAQGLLQWVPARSRFEPVPGAPTTTVHALAVADDGTVWLSEEGRLSRYHWKGGRLTLQAVIGAGSGYPDVSATGLVVDAQGVVWAATARGLIRADPQLGNVRLYGVHDGLPSQEFRRRTLTRTVSGRIVGGTPAGVVVLDPRLVKPSNRRAPLVIERVEVRRGDRVADLTHLAPLEIADADRDLRIVARLLSFADSSSNSYRYRLAGYDPDWVEVGPAGERVFSRLPPGRYRLEVQARSADQVWSRVQALEFRVQPPWWRSLSGLLVLTSMALLLMSLFAWLYRRRLQRRHAYQLALQKQELAEQASAAKTRFLANLGHEVRTPMTGVLGMSELLLGSPLDARQRGWTESIRHAGEHLLHLVNDALDLARIESGKLQLQAQPFHLQSLLDDVCTLMAALAEQKQLRFVVENSLPPGTCSVGDAVRVRQILLNLLGNAVKFTTHGEVRLKVAALSAEGGLYFEVSDTGPGIGSDQQQRLFRRFEQADGARTAAQYGGSGLGLAICRELALAMQGQIGVESQLGVGTRFSVSLPLPLQAAATAEGKVVAVDGVALPPLRILLVEDDLTVASVITGLLGARGHQMVHAEHALAALREVSAAPFDVVLLDLDLPGLGGLELAGHLRNQGYDMPLVAVTARTDPGIEEQVSQAGFNGFLRKPVTGDLLVAAIARALRG
ncbi:hybrid sensor histidine kinase/response regulator [Stenotrophomonas rhizophila]|uniref:hybrid sensor histidine kinase/response regulator n=1 Tax=Stenotrophomonas rhizophila TaxID=216778 RepID=UPI001E4CA9AE|nr:two-component regulator propeller domain-containing protein [Stenotrophomonas rhizophila]MCC7632670.1 response regulator [Stenotrophomonas rhizophila]MCC7663522.1 response regulator [Stenotrophomonas rhizophila]